MHLTLNWCFPVCDVKCVCTKWNLQPVTMCGKHPKVNRTCSLPKLAVFHNCSYRYLITLATEKML